MESFADLARRRYSVRRFADEPIEPALLEAVLEAGRLAPTGCDAQPQRILVLDSKPDLARLATCTPYTYRAPVALIVCHDVRVSWKSPEGHDVGEIDAALVACHMALAATELGLGTLFVCGYDEGTLRATFDIPDTYRVTLILMVGHPALESHPHPRLHERLPLEATVFFGSFSEEDPC